jgi:hypothetical protein
MSADDIPVIKLSCSTELPGELFDFSRIPLFKTSSVYVSVGTLSVTIQLSPLWSSHLPRWFRSGRTINIEVAYQRSLGPPDSSAHYGLKLIVIWLGF